MKEIKLILALFIFSCIFAGTVDAQAVVVKDQPWFLFGQETDYAHEVLTPSGRVNLKINFMLPPDNYWILIAKSIGPFSIEVTAERENVKVYGTGTFFPDGRVMVIGHRKP